MLNKRICRKRICFRGLQILHHGFNKRRYFNKHQYVEEKVNLMKNKWKMIITINVIFALFIIVGTTVIIHSQKQDKQNNPSQINQQKKEVPIADYNESLPRNIEERTEREKKNKARNLKLQKSDDPKRFMLTEERESTYGLIPSHAPIEPAIPAKESAAVIIGEITNSKAYLSEDKTSIYSEFEVSNTNVLKNTTPETFSIEKPNIVSRAGGGVRFPSGKVIDQFLLGNPMPQIGRKYLFFLKYSTETEFSIITAYELTQGQVLPLDGVMPNGKVIRQLAGYQSFKGISEVIFLNQVKEAIEKNLDIFTKGE